MTESTATSISTGHHGCATHCGTTMTPWALSSTKCSSVLAINAKGGSNQLFSPHQCCVNASAASASGTHARLLNRWHWAFLPSANRSTVNGPHLLSSMEKTDLLNPQS